MRIGERWRILWRHSMMISRGLISQLSPNPLNLERDSDPPRIKIITKEIEKHFPTEAIRAHHHAWQTSNLEQSKNNKAIAKRLVIYLSIK